MSTEPADLVTVVYPGPFDGVRVLALNRVVAAGEPLPVAPALAAQLVAQGWKHAKTAPAKTAAAKKASGRRRPAKPQSSNPADEATSKETT